LKKTVIMFMLFLIPNALMAQVYTGQVVDGSTAAAIGGAKIFGAKGVVVTTDQAGYFILEADTAQVEVSAPGYRKKTLELDSGNTRIELYDFNVYEMSRFVVKADQDEAVIQISKQDLSAEIINQTTASLFPDVMKVVQLLPGVATNHEMSSLLFIRGGDPDEMLAILDDMVIIDPYMWGGMISVFNPNMVEKLEFQSGGFSAQWPQAMSGILNVKNKIGNPEKFKGFIDLSATTLDVFVEGPSLGPADSSFMFGLRRTHYDLLINLLYADESLVFPYFYDGQLKLAFPFDKNMVTLNSIFSFEGMHMKRSPEEGYSSENTGEREFMFWDVNFNLSLASDYKFSETLSALTLLGAYYNQGEYSFTDAFTPFNMEKDQVIIQLRHVWQWDISESQHVRAGVYLFPAWGEVSIVNSVRLPTGNNSYYVDTIDERMQTGGVSFAGVFLQDEIMLLRDLFYINPSINVQYYTPNEQYIANPRIMLKVQPLPVWEVNLATGLYSQYPISGQQIDDSLGNPDLLAEEALHYVAGTKVTIMEDVSIVVDGYYKDYSGLIVSDADPDINYTNNGDGYAYGLDVMLKREIGGKWDGWLSYSWIKTQRRINGRTDPETLGRPESATPVNEWYTPITEQPHTLNLVVNYNFTETWKLALTQKYSSGSLYTPIVSGEYQAAINEWTPVYGKYNSERYPDYLSTDIKLSMPFFGLANWRSYIQVTNLFGNANVNSYQYKNDYSDKREINQLPRLIIGGIRWNF